MNSFNLTLSEKHFICPSILNDSFAGYSNLGCRSLPFMTLNTSFQPILACKVSFEKSADSLMGTPLQVTVSLSLAAFKILSLSLILASVIMMCLGVFLLGSNFFGTLGFLGLHVYFLHQTGEVFLHYFFKQIFHFLLFLFSSGTPMIWMLECLKLSQRLLSLSSFFLDSCFFNSVLVECLFLPSVLSH